MINNVGLYNAHNINGVNFSANNASISMPNVKPLNWALNNAPLNKTNTPNLSKIQTKLTSDDEIKMYDEIVSAFATNEKEKISRQDGVSRQKKLEALLKSGTLLNTNSSDNSSTLKNLYKIIKSKRAADIDSVKIAGEVIDTLYNPAIITQRFGDIPKEAQVFIMNKNDIEDASRIKEEGSGTCVSASIEFHMASKLPAEFTRWIEGLTSPDIQVKKTIDLSALSKNKMDAMWLLKEFEVPVENLNFNSANLIIKPDKNAIARAQIQDNYWDNGERTITDALMQSTLMNLGSQQTYNALTDRREGKFNANPQGLIEFEKTFVESVVDNKERNSVVYQIVDEDQNLKGWSDDYNKIQQDIISAVDSGENVIVGYVLTAEQCNEKGVNPNKIVNGHEITIVDYKKDPFGKITFICNDTDDDKPEFIEYKADYLLPKIHHASYPVEILENNRKKAS